MHSTVPGDHVGREAVEHLGAAPVIDAVNDHGVVRIGVDGGAGERGIVPDVELERKIGRALPADDPARSGGDHELAVVIDAGGLGRVRAGLGIVGLDVFRINDDKDVGGLTRCGEFHCNYPSNECFHINKAFRTCLAFFGAKGNHRFRCREPLPFQLQTVTARLVTDK